LFDHASLVNSVPFLQERAIAAARPRRGFGLFLMVGALTLAIFAGWQGMQRSSGGFSPAKLALDVSRLDLGRLFEPETVVVTPDSSVFGREQAMSSTELMARWEPMIQQAAQKFHVPAQWIRAVMRQESGGRTVLSDNSPIASGAGAVGLMQLMPGTYSEMAAQYKLGNDPFDPLDNIYAGAAYLNWLHRKYGYPAMFAAYNDGPGHIEDHLHRGRPLPAETRGYIASIAHYLKQKTQGQVALTQPDGVKLKIDAAKVTAVKPAMPGIYAANVHAVISMGKIHRGVREDVAVASALLRAQGAAI